MLFIVIEFLIADYQCLNYTWLFIPLKSHYLMVENPQSGVDKSNCHISQNTNDETYFVSSLFLFHDYLMWSFHVNFINMAAIEDASKICYKCKKAGHLSRDCPENPDESSNDHANGSVEGDPHVGLGDTAPEMDKVAMEEDDIHEIGEEDKGKLNDVDYLTGNPLPGDILLYAVPVCGPYNAVQSYKYRVKIIPGSAKKGKGIQNFCS